MPWRVPPPCGRDDAARSHLGTKRTAVLRNIAAAEQEATRSRENGHVNVWHAEVLYG